MAANASWRRFLLGLVGNVSSLVKRDSRNCSSYASVVYSIGLQSLGVWQPFWHRRWTDWLLEGSQVGKFLKIQALSDIIESLNWPIPEPPPSGLLPMWDKFSLLFEPFQAGLLGTSILINVVFLTGKQFESKDLGFFTSGSPAPKAKSGLL